MNHRPVRLMEDFAVKPFVSLPDCTLKRADGKNLLLSGDTMTQIDINR